MLYYNIFIQIKALNPIVSMKVTEWTTEKLGVNVLHTTPPELCELFLTSPKCEGSLKKVKLLDKT